jgi:hypothetical protein
MATDATQWQLLAEEYRTMADNALTESARTSLEGLASTYDILARQANAGTEWCSARDCLARAEECDRHRDHAPTPRVREQMADLANRWRAMAREAGAARQDDLQA